MEKSLKVHGSGIGVFEWQLPDNAIEAMARLSPHGQENMRIYLTATLTPFLRGLAIGCQTKEWPETFADISKMAEEILAKIKERLN